MNIDERLQNLAKKGTLNISLRPNTENLRTHVELRVEVNRQTVPFHGFGPTLEAAIQHLEKDLISNARKLTVEVPEQ